MKYSINFERDFNYYIKMRNIFNFDGSNENIIQYDKNGVDGKKAFFEWDSNGKIKPTKHPNIVKRCLKTKGSINLNIKMYAEDRASGILPKTLFNEIIKEFNLLPWIIEAVENQKSKYYK